MLPRRARRWHTLGAAVLLAGTLSAGAVLYVHAKSASPPQVIHACVNNSSGTVKIVGATDTCKGNESTLSWNQQGPKGDQGIQGIQGVQGPPGVSGYYRSFYEIPLGLSLSPGSESGTNTVHCGPGFKVLGGGASLTQNNPNGGAIVISQSYPVSDSDWVVVFANPSAATVGATVVVVYAICATAL
jgi:hypothetical protein